MNPLQKIRMKATFKYTWPLYLISAVLIVFLMMFTFNVTHKAPAYRSLTLFVSGEVTNEKQLKGDIVSKYQDKGLKSLSFIEADPQDGYYYTKLTVPGYNSADILIIPSSYLEKFKISDIAIEFDENLINNYFDGYTFYSQEDVKYGVKIDTTKINNYMVLAEDCYMFLNHNSGNLGEYNKKPDKDHDVALNVVRDWGI